MVARLPVRSHAVRSAARKTSPAPVGSTTFPAGRPRYRVIAPSRTATPPSSPAVSTIVARGASRRRSSILSSLPTSSTLASTSPAEPSRGDGPGSTLSTQPESSSRLSSPCHPTPTRPPPRTAAEATASQSRPSSPATGTSNHPAALRHAAGSARAGSGSLLDSHRCRRWPPASRFSKIGPWLSSTSRSDTPASSSSRSSSAAAAGGSTPSRQPTRKPSLATASEQYVADPPSRQPRGSSAATSREAAPATTTWIPALGSGESRPGPRVGEAYTRRSFSLFLLEWNCVLLRTSRGRR